MFEKFGICTTIQFFRFLLKLILIRKEPKLFIRDLTFKDVPVRIYQPKRPSTGLRRGLVYLHGGSGMLGNKSIYKRKCCYLARESDSVVVFVDFRLGPEHQHPAQLSDCLTATVYFMQNAKEYGVDPNCIVVGGESSGGILCATVCRELVKKMHLPKIRAQILLYPFLQMLNFSLPSHQQNRFGPGLFTTQVIKYILMYLNEKTENLEGFLNNAHVPEEVAAKFKKWISADLIPEEFKTKGYEPPLPVPFSKELYKSWAMLSPLLDEDAIVQQLPQTYILTCEFDSLRDDGLLYKKRLEDNAVPVTWNHQQDGFHGVTMFVDTGLFEFSSTREVFKDIIHFIKGL
ncbi:arylacetamide deacetylase-like 4 [Elgaria multicarinata webbii]|uniref:arylacetamide deacetylase-like 4 n=1 Tax=Elgaria multicarinata webbii TaxID=159646 RepID=UPI002FCD3FB4